MIEIAPRTGYIDVKYLGVSHLIACGVLETDDGLYLIDPGPTTALDMLRQRLGEVGFSLADVRGILLTHIHLDHAGATGSIVTLNPDIQVYVHEIGARHMIDPGRLLASAQRIYGDLMDHLWGDFLPVAESNVHTLAGDETLKVGGRTLRVAYTPGHAKHHVSYLDIETGTACVGDVTGMRVRDVDYVVPVTPPPDVDLALWYESLNTVRSWNPERLFLTHFGPSEEVTWHLNEMEHRLSLWAEQARVLLNEDGTDADLAARFHETAMAETYRKVPARFHAQYEQMGQPSASWYGLARYWRKQAERTH